MVTWKVGKHIIPRFEFPQVTIQIPLLKNCLIQYILGHGSDDTINHPPVTSNKPRAQLLVYILQAPEWIKAGMLKPGRKPVLVIGEAVVTKAAERFANPDDFSNG